MLTAGDSVFLRAHSQYRGLLVGIARRLRDEVKAEIHLYCTNEQEATYYRRFNLETELFASVVPDNSLYENADRPVSDEAAVIGTARANEVWLGAPINTLALADRHFGRGYALAGFNHPRSRWSERTSYAQMLQGFNAQIAFWREEFDTKRPRLLINGTRVAARIAHKLGVPVRILAGSRFKSLHQWAHNDFLENPAVEAAYRRLGGEQVAEAVLIRPYDSHMDLRKVFLRSTSTFGVVRSLGDRVLRRIWWRLRGYDKAKGYYTGEELRYFIRRWRDRRALTGAKLAKLSDMKGARFVFYPLHTEPETALHQLSPEYFYQLSAIAALSRDLPAGVMLAVKETYHATGRRPAEFYDQIREFKNVVLLDMLELGLDVVRQCDAVATITGTAGFEAAVLGKPVITFGRHNQYNFLSHVRLVTDETQLKTCLHGALNGGFDREAMRREGARFLAAVKDVSFDLDGYKITDPESADPSVVDHAYRNLLATIE